MRPGYRTRGSGHGCPLLPKSDCDGSPATPGEAFNAEPLKSKWIAALAEYHPNVVVLLAGRWEIVDRMYNGAWTNILVPVFAAYVKQELEAASNMFTAAGANVVFLTAPCVDEQTQPDGQPWPENDPARLAAYNALVRTVADEHPRTDSVVDLDASVCPKGVYSAEYKGVMIRESDGIHFTDEAGIAPPRPSCRRSTHLARRLSHGTTRMGPRNPPSLSALAGAPADNDVPEAGYFQPARPRVRCPSVPRTPGLLAPT